MTGAGQPARWLGWARRLRRSPSPAAAVGPDAQGRRKRRAAALSIASNTILIGLKVMAGLATGSIAILTEAAHSGIDLIASVVAFFAVRKAEEPADRDHPYGHAKVEHVAAAIEGMLILIGAAVIVIESLRRLVDAAPVDNLGFGIAVIAASGVGNLLVSAYLTRQARATDSPALEGDAAHLRTDAMTSFGVLTSLVLVELTGIEQLVPLTALLVAGAIILAGLRILRRSARVLVDEALPEAELRAVRDAVEGAGGSEVVGFHMLRARRAGSRRHVDMHVQFRHGTSLERAHDLTHQITRAIRRRLRGADVLVHLEPEHAAREPDAEDPARDPEPEDADRKPPDTGTEPEDTGDEARLADAALEGAGGAGDVGLGPPPPMPAPGLGAEGDPPAATR